MERMLPGPPPAANFGCIAAEPGYPALSIAMNMGLGVSAAGMAKITGIGGIFFKTKSDHKALAAWYAKNLGLTLEAWGGAILKWPDDKAEDRGLTVWHVAEKESQWFSPSGSSFMINYRVDNLDEMLAQLRENGVTIVKGPEADVNGRFAWIMDPDDNKVELWQPMISDDKNKNV